MRSIIFSYSVTGNNDRLALSMAKALDAKHIKVEDKSKRSILTIILDIIFKRIPKIKDFEYELHRDDKIIFVGPVWMGQTSTPFRKIYEKISTLSNKYAFVTISGGALGKNLKVKDELESRVGRSPYKFIEFLIADIIDSEKPTMKQTSAYRLKDEESKKFALEAIKQLNDN